MNGVNIGLFQFEYDLTWMAFFMDAENRFYARYGGRDDGDAESHLSKKSLLKVMEEVLQLHEKREVATRHEPSAEPARTPEDIPPLMRELKERKEDERCIHCHQVKAGEFRRLQEEGKFSRQLVFSYPMPRAVGIEVDRDDQRLVRAVESGSPAAAAGVRAGDLLRAADGRRILTAADFSRVLELQPREAELPLDVERDGAVQSLRLKLTGDWRRSGDPSWRASVEGAGPNAGFWARELDGDERRAAGIAADALALKVTFLYPGHPTPPRSGLKLGDVVIDLAGKRREMTMRQFHADFSMNRAWGEKVPVIVFRGGREEKLELELPPGP
jgi:hypothetical protein